MSFAKLISKQRELIVYCLIGCTGASLDFAVYSVLTRCVALHYQLANFIGVSCGILNNFFLNYYFNFKARGHLPARLASFYAVGMVGCAMSAFLLWLLIGRMHLNAIAAKLCTIAFVTVVQFCMNKLLTFRRTSPMKEKVHV